MNNSKNISNKILRSLLCFMLTVSSLISISAQQVLPNKSNIVEHQIHIGYASDFFDPPEIGFYTAYNPSYKINNYVSVEGQVAGSFLKFEAENGIFAAKESTRFSANTLVGLRAYLRPAKHNFRFYVNAMGGIQYLKESYPKFESVEEGIRLAAAFGLYAEYKKITTGLAIEGVDRIVLKVGYKL